MIPYSRQEINSKDIKSVIEVLKSDFITQGKKVPEFENKVKKLVNAKFAIAVNSATSGLHIACIALGLGKNDKLWTSPISFVASSNVALLCGANVEFVDINPSTNNMCIRNLEKMLKSAKKNNSLPKIVMPVHMAGQSCEMKEIHKLSKLYGFRIIEDASHAIGGKYKNSFIGSCKYSDAVVFSFHPVKIITTGEGGMVLCKKKSINDKLLLLRNHGITRDKDKLKKKNVGQWHYEQHILGYNYRMTDFQAALGISQLKRINSFIKARNKIANRYNKFLKNLPLKLPTVSKNCISTFHLYIIRLNLEKIKKSHKEVFSILRKRGINVNLHYIPIHYHPFYKELLPQNLNLIESERYFNEAISIPIYPKLSLKEQKKIVNDIKETIL